MSRIGKNPVTILDGVEIKLNGNTIEVKGPKGTLSFTFRSNVKVEVKEKEILVTRINNEKDSRALHGLSRTLIANMVEGVKKGFSKNLEINGVGYRAQVQGNKLILTLGFSHPVEMIIPEGLEVKMHEKNKNELIVSGIDKQKVGQFSAEIREWRKPEPYKGKGIRYKGEYVRRKAGKAIKK